MVFNTQMLFPPTEWSPTAAVTESMDTIREFLSQEHAFRDLADKVERVAEQTAKLEKTVVHEAEGVKQLKKLRSALSDARHSMQRKGGRGVRLHCTCACACSGCC